MTQQVVAGAVGNDNNMVPLALADWPGLGPTQMLDGRDLRPTLDLRGVIASVVQRQFSLATGVLSGQVLPGAAPVRQDLWRA